MKKQVLLSRMLTFFRQTNPKFTPSVLIISLFIISSITSRFVYIYYLGDNDLEGDFFGFGWLSSLLYSFGFEISLLSFGALMWISTMFHPKKSNSKKLFRFVAMSMISLAFFFISWIFTDKAYWTDAIEIVFAILICIPTTILFVLFLMFFSREITNLKEFKSIIFDFFIELRNVHVFGLLKNVNILESLDRHDLDQKQRREIIARLKIERNSIVEKLDERLKEQYEVVNP